MMGKLWKVETPAIIKGGTINQLNGVWWRSVNDVVAVGQQGMILFYDGTTWTTMTADIKTHLFGVWASSTGNVFADR